MTDQGEIILYQSEDSTQLEVRIENETVWLTQLQMMDLFQTSKQNVSLHINNIFKENELTKDSTVKEILTVRQEGVRTIKRKVEFFNLDVIISVGYRVKSLRGTQFRIWANNILREDLLKGYVLNHRIDRIEKKILEHDEKFDLLIKTTLPPHEGIFMMDKYLMHTSLLLI